VCRAALSLIVVGRESWNFNPPIRGKITRSGTGGPVVWPCFGPHQTGESVGSRNRYFDTADRAGTVLWTKMNDSAG